jgi:hypothetical protein
MVKAVVRRLYGGDPWVDEFFCVEGVIQGEVRLGYLGLVRLG